MGRGEAKQEASSHRTGAGVERVSRQGFLSMKNKSEAGVAREVTGGTSSLLWPRVQGLVCYLQARVPALGAGDRQDRSSSAGGLSWAL